jgi:hypothetical protein
MVVDDRRQLADREDEDEVEEELEDSDALGPVGHRRIQPRIRPPLLSVAPGTNPIPSRASEYPGLYSALAHD